MKFLATQVGSFPKLLRDSLILPNDSPSPARKITQFSERILHGSEAPRKTEASRMLAIPRQGKT